MVGKTIRHPDMVERIGTSFPLFHALSGFFSSHNWNLFKENDKGNVFELDKDKCIVLYVIL